MSGWIWTALVLSVYLVGWYRSTLMMARWSNEHHERRWLNLPLSEYKGEHLGIAMILAVVWPIVLPIRLIHARMIGLVSPTEREMRDRNAQLQREIDRLEREAGIR